MRFDGLEGSVTVRVCVSSRGHRVANAEARVQEHGLRELRRANNRQVFSKDINNARVAAKMHVERVRLCNLQVMERHVLQELYEVHQWRKYVPPLIVR